MTPALLSRRNLLLLAFACMSANVAHAAGSNVSVPQAKPTRSQTGSMHWKDLSLQRQQALKPLQADWDSLDETRQKKWLVIADSFPSLDPAQQARAQSKMQEWVRLNPEQRRIARDSYLRAKSLNTTEKNAKWERYQQLSEEEKNKLAAKTAKKKHLLTSPPVPSKK